MWSAISEKWTAIVSAKIEPVYSVQSSVYRVREIRSIQGEAMQMIDGLEVLNTVDLTRLVFHIIKILDFNTGSKIITELWNILNREKEETIEE